MTLRLVRLVALVAVIGLLAACSAPANPTTTPAPDEPDTTQTEASQPPTGDDSGDDPDVEVSEWGLPVVDPIEVDPSVDVLMAGSSTVFPLSTAVLSKWIDEGGPEYSIDSIGSGGGLERFCVEGASDIANASRAINDDETAACAENGREAIEILVGSDALSIVISPGNYFAQELTLEELAIAWSTPNATWADVNPDFPAHPIQLFTPGADSGTFDYMNEVLFDEEQPSPILSANAEVIGEDDNLTVTGVAEDGCTEGDVSSTCAMGYFGYAYYEQNADRLQTVGVEGVHPSAETVADGSYPIARPLFLYTAETVLDAKPQVAEFIAYYLNNVNDVISQVGYFPAPDAELQEAADTIAEAAGW